MRVSIFLNGMVLVFGKDGEQIPELQGRWELLKNRILKTAEADTDFALCDWINGSRMEITREQAARIDIMLQQEDNWPGVIPVPEDK